MTTENEPLVISDTAINLSKSVKGFLNVRNSPF